jgi:predicted TIM-barrel fold metal-dependent hydrolase
MTRIIHSVFLLLLSLQIVGCASGSKITNQEAWPKRVIDAHAHTFILNENGEYAESDPEKIKTAFLKARNEAGVIASVAHTHTINEGYVDMRRDNVFHCVGARPPYSVTKIEKALKEGRFSCIKIYLGYIPAYATDPVYKPAYQLAEKYNVPVVFHTGDVSNPDALVKYADPISIDEVAVKYRKINFVIAHCGNPWIQTAAELAYKNSNVYLDGSAFLTGDLKNVSKEKVDAVMINPIKWILSFVENPKKMIFGSDYPLVDVKGYIKLFKDAVPEEDWDDVFYNNAVRVFNLKIK